MFNRLRWGERYLGSCLELLLCELTLHAFGLPLMKLCDVHPRSESSKPVHNLRPHSHMKMIHWLSAGFFSWGMVTLKGLHCNDMNILTGSCQSPNLYALKYPLGSNSA